MSQSSLEVAPPKPHRITQSPSSISSSLSESSVSLGTSVGGDESAGLTIASCDSCDSEPTIEVVFIYKFCCLFIIIYMIWIFIYVKPYLHALLFLKNVEIGT